MGFITGLKEIEKLVEERQAAQAASSRKVRWLNVSDGQSVKVRFVNEMDESSPHYSADRGLVIVAYEHSNPQDFHRKALCTMDTEGRCFGCDMNERGVKGWYKKTRGYFNLLVDDGVEEPYVAVWSMAAPLSPTFDLLKEYFVETKSISNLTWRLKRSGTGNTTVWTLIPGGPDAVPFDWTGIQIPNLENALWKVPFADQEKYYLGIKSAKEDETAEASIPW